MPSSSFLCRHPYTGETRHLLLRFLCQKGHFLRSEVKQSPHSLVSGGPRKLSVEIGGMMTLAETAELLERRPQHDDSLEWEEDYYTPYTGHTVRRFTYHSHNCPSGALALWRKRVTRGACPLTGHQEGCGRQITPPRGPSGWSGSTLRRNRPERPPELYQSGSWLDRAGDLRTIKWNFHFRVHSFLMLRWAEATKTLCRERRLDDTRRNSSWSGASTWRLSRSRGGLLHSTHWASCK